MLAETDIEQNTRVLVETDIEQNFPLVQGESLGQDFGMAHFLTIAPMTAIEQFLHADFGFAHFCNDPQPFSGDLTKSVQSTTDRDRLK